MLEDAPGSQDSPILARLAEEERVLLTFDKDFGELAVKIGLPPTSGIILFRLLASPPAQMASLLTNVVLSRQDWAGRFSVVEANRVRMRPLRPPHG